LGHKRRGSFHQLSGYEHIKDSVLSTIGYSAVNENMTVDDAKEELETSFSLARETTGILSECGKNRLGPIIEIAIS